MKSRIRLRKKTNPARIMVLGFLAIIMLGTLLLSLPIASRDAAPLPFMSALFTATSATCVTGLTVADTATTFSTFGQIVILLLFQIGGLGFMSATTIFFFLMSRKINLSQRILIMQSLSLKDTQGVIQIIRRMLIGTFVLEGIGAAVLAIRFVPTYGLWHGLGMGVFHAVSAFCNAGFDLFGTSAAGPFSSLAAYSGDVTVSLCVILLVIAGGLGFFVWNDIWRKRRFSALHLHSKLVLATSAVLLIGGALAFFVSEMKNPATLGTLPLPEALLASLFQATMTRSSGFAMFDTALLSKASLMIMIPLMLVGASPGSTGGGIKNTTAAILFLSALRSLRGKKGLSVFRRNIPDAQIISALAILVLALAVCFVGTVAILIIQPELAFGGVVFEMVSAVATCGFSRGITPSLSPASLMIVTASMFLGRVGIMTFAMGAFLRRHHSVKTKHPDTWVMQ